MRRITNFIKKHISFNQDLGLQILALYVLLVGIVVLAAGLFARFANQRLEADIKASDQAIARSIAQETEIRLSNAMEAVESLSKYPAVIEADTRSMEKLFKNIITARPDINLVYRLDPRGFMLFHYPTGPGSTVGNDFSFRDYFQLARLTTRPLISKGRRSPTTEQPVATAVMPIWDNRGNFLGVVATNIRLEFLSQTLKKITSEYQEEENFQVMIVDSLGQIIAHPDSDMLLVGARGSQPEVTDSVLLGRSGNLIGEDEAGQETLYSHVPVPIAGWGVIVSRPTARAFSTPRTFTRGVMVALGIFIIAGILFWTILSRQVIRPLESLASYSQTISQKLDITRQQQSVLDRLLKRRDQVGHLTRSLISMEESIQARVKELSTLLQTSGSVVSTLDSQTVLDRILNQVERLLDVNKSAIIALNEKHGVFRAQASRGLSKRYTDHITIDPSEPLSLTMRAIRTGEPIQISDTETDSTFSALRPRARSEGYRSVLAVPLKTTHAPPSALLVYKPEPHTFTKSEINLLSNFANHAAMAIENATLFANSDMLLNEQTRRLEALIQSMNDGLILEDPEGQIVYANRRVSELAGLPPEIIASMSVSEIIDHLVNKSSDPETNKEEVKVALEDPESKSAEISIPHNGRTCWLRLHVFDVTDSEGISIGRGQLIHDITSDRELDRMKSSLISTVSHELRTPLASIKGYATTLLAEDVQWDDLSQSEFLKIISDETDRLSDLVSDLLDLSRIESGSLVVAQDTCDLKELIFRSANRAQPKPGNRLEVYLDPDLPPIYADSQRIESVLRNLIENATKYAGPTSPITVSGSIDGDVVIIRVEDEGPGIPPGHSDRIFESFYRVEDGLNRTASGAGLGLAICRGFIQAHGGNIWVEPRATGTCIAFSLPLNDQN
jgi:PAS domain S-box-containing protein